MADQVRRGQRRDAGNRKRFLVVWRGVSGQGAGMVEIVDIVDRGSLEAWLQDQPKEVSVWIARRAAMRALPFYWEWTVTSKAARDADLTAFPFLRFYLISEVERKMPTFEVTAASAAASYAVSRAAIAAAAPAAFESAAPASSAIVAAAEAAATHAAAKASASASLAARAAADAARAAADASDEAVARTVVAAAEAAAESAAHAAAAAGRAAAAVVGAAAWTSIRADCKAIAEGDDLEGLELWAAGDNPLVGVWTKVKVKLLVHSSPRSEETARGDAPVDWSFWVKWYDSVLAGEPLNGDMLKEIALIDPAEWEKGAARVNLLIGEIEQKYSGSPLSQSSIADFTFDAAKRWMEMVGFEGDVAHLRDPDRVQAFLDDIGEMQDGFQDFIDFTQDVSTGSNTVAVYTSASEKVLRELQRVQDTKHIRARRLITLGGYLYSFSLEEDKRAELGESLTIMLDSNVDLLRETCRKHFAPSLVRMAPLDELELGDADPKEILADLKASLARIQNADGQELVPLSAEALAVLKDMISELEDLQSAMGEVRTGEYRAALRKRFAKGVGGFAATIGRYIEKAKPHSAKAGKWVDGAIKGFKRWNTLADIVEWFGNIFGGGLPPA